MTRQREFLGVWLLIATVAITAGCTSGTDTPAEAQPAAINATTPETKQPAAPTPKTTKPAADPSHPVVKIETSMGDITVRLDREKAPLTVENFLSYVEHGFYDQTIFHQVLNNYVVLAGGYTSMLAEKAARAAPVRNEARNGRKNTRGTIAMARRPHVIDSSTSQFFINVADNPQLDHKESTRGVVGPPEEYGYCVFGDVTEGMDVVTKISAVPVQDKGDLERTPIQPVLVRSIRRIQ